MIYYKFVNKCCKDDYTQIENYEQAINDNSQTWVLHHKLEIHEDYINSKEQMINMGLYYNRPASELIFLTKADHNRLHNKHRKLSEETLKQKSESMKSFWRSEEGEIVKQEMKQKLRVIHLGKVLSEETKKKISNSKKGSTPWNKGKKKEIYDRA